MLMCFAFVLQLFDFFPSFCVRDLFSHVFVCAVFRVRDLSEWFFTFVMFFFIKLSHECHRLPSFSKKQQTSKNIQLIIFFEKKNKTKSKPKKHFRKMVWFVSVVSLLVHSFVFCAFGLILL